MKRTLACLAGSFSLGASLYAYLGYVYMLGFPDNYITELGFAERKLAVVFIYVSVGMGAYLLYLGVLAGARELGGRLPVAVAIYLLFLLGVILIDCYCQAHLMGGEGG